MSKPHLVYTKPPEGYKTYKQPSRGGKQKEENPSPNYQPMQADFSRYLTAFQTARTRRHQDRSIPVSAHLDYIRVSFFDVFDNAKYESGYREKFGITAVEVDHFGRRVLFVIRDEVKFQSFLRILQAFVDVNLTHSVSPMPERDILFIREFELLTTDIIIPPVLEDTSNIILNLVSERSDIFDASMVIQASLAHYLDSQSVRYEEIPDNDTVQLWNVTQAQLRDLADNFDIIHSARPNSFGLISPGRFGTATRSFGFTVVPPPTDAPIIGILDTGISDQTPLTSLIVNSRQDDPFDLTGTNARVDNWGNTWGHGTGVAGIAAFGARLYPVAQGEVQADARLLSIKILDSRVPRVSDKVILEAIRHANKEMGVRLFVLTILEDVKNDNETTSALAYALDVLAHELDILICIAGGNMNREAVDINSGVLLPYPSHFADLNNNIRIPAESMNNLTVGAVANNLNPSLTVAGIANDATFPAIYTSKCHVDFATSGLSSNQFNKQFGKPDVLYFGGDLETNGEKESTGLSVLTPRVGHFWMRDTGTSYAAPFVANLAARILAEYPSLSMQSVKAMLINSAVLPRVDNSFDGLSKPVLKRVLGKGIPDLATCLASTDNEVTIILEENIIPENIEVYSLKLPTYLRHSNRSKGLLAFEATLCFKFKPIQHSQIAYCPLHLGFGIFKNKTLEEINEGTAGPKKDIKTGDLIQEGYSLGESWSQDPYYKGKLLCNTQKISFTVGKQHILNEDFTFKVAVSSKFSKLLTEAQKSDYADNIDFSLVIRVKELPYKGVYIDSLYDGLVIENELQALAALDADLEAEAEAEND